MWPKPSSKYKLLSVEDEESAEINDNDSAQFDPNQSPKHNSGKKELTTKLIKRIDSTEGLGPLAPPIQHTENREDDELFGLDEISPYLVRLVVLVKQSLPVVASFFLAYGVNFINLIFAGHYIEENGSKSSVFAGVSLANVSLFNSTVAQ